MLDPTEVELSDVKSEQRFEGYQPDVIFTAVNRSLLMEIAVTHPARFSKASLIPRQRIEAFEIDIKSCSVPGNMALEAVENHVRRGAPR